MNRRSYSGIFLDHIRPIAWCRNWAPRTTPTLPGVELGLKDNLPTAWCETGPQGPPPSLKDHCQSSLEYHSYAVVFLASHRCLGFISSRLPVRVIIVPTGTKSVCETL